MIVYYVTLDILGKIHLEPWKDNNKQHKREIGQSNSKSCMERNVKSEGSHPLIFTDLRSLPDHAFLLVWTLEQGKTPKQSRWFFEQMSLHHSKCAEVVATEWEAIGSLFSK